MTLRSSPLLAALVSIVFALAAHAAAGRSDNGGERKAPGDMRAGAPATGERQDPAAIDPSANLDLQSQPMPAAEMTVAPVELQEHPHVTASKQAMAVGAEMHAAGHDIHATLEAAAQPGAPVEASAGANERAIERLQGQRSEAAAVAGDAVPAGEARPMPSLGQLSHADRVEQLNARVAALLKGLNDANTKAQIVFRRVELNDERAVDVAADLFYEKKGPTGKVVRLDVRNVSYAFPESEGAVPELNVDAALVADLVKIASQETLDRMAPADDAALVKMLKEYSPAGRSHQDAVTADGHIYRKIKDAAGHIVALGLEGDLTVDVSKIPAADLPQVRELAAHGDAEITRHGLQTYIRVALNSKETSFSHGQQGLKEWLEALLGGDMEKFQGVLMMAGYLDRAAADLVKPDAPPPAPPAPPAPPKS